MKLQKIQLWFKWGYITPLESDTILWYVFSKCFEELEEVFLAFKDGKPPFLVSNGVFEGAIHRPIVFSKTEHTKKTLEEDLIFEKDRKLLKTLTHVGFSKQYLSNCFDWLLEMEEMSQLTDWAYLETSEIKNMVPRFSSWEVSPYSLTNIIYPKKKYVIYVKIWNHELFMRFFEKMRSVLLSVGWWKAVSRGFWKLSCCELLDLSEQESLAFEFIEEMKIKKGLYLVLNNYKPQDWEIDKINLEESCVHLVNKNGKSSSDIVFKWNMKFIGPWSVLVANDWTWEGVMGSYYQSGLSFNFWYLF